jgi:hypothetical protein
VRALATIIFGEAFLPDEYVARSARAVLSDAYFVPALGWHCPYIPLRWAALENENYGRGHCEEYLGDLRSLEDLSKDLAANLQQRIDDIDANAEAIVTLGESLQDGRVVELLVSAGGRCVHCALPGFTSALTAAQDSLALAIASTLAGRLGTRCARLRLDDGACLKSA